MKVFGEDSPVEFIHPDEMQFSSPNEDDDGKVGVCEEPSQKIMPIL